MAGEILRNSESFLRHLPSPFYKLFLSPRMGLGALPAIYTFSATFCSLLLVGFGHYVQYCPGTLCFIQIHLDYLQHRQKELSWNWYEGQMSRA